MSNNRNTYQQVETVSIKRNEIINLATNLDLSKKDYRVLLLLFTQLDGYSIPQNNRREWKDPLNFKMLNLDAIADTLCLSLKETKKSIKTLHEEGIIEKGDNGTTVIGGYRFTF